MELKEKILLKLKTHFKDVDFSTEEFRGEYCITIPNKIIVDACELLKNDEELAFNLCEDITAVDWGRLNNRFTMVYFIFSMKNRFRLKIKCDLGDGVEKIDSVTSVWKSANWAEREVYDMYGIEFNNHPDLRRMYMPESFEYHPLRKEFPVMGIPGSLSLPKK
ncbi:MAG: NADH-quinone oxidoreductase subunit C [Ignavibacteriales bacterium]|jgi:NADH-quinone oxidoreductase subunit C|nr:NADH-quinone oxidoreductase subunit C [Ignavibacteriaceae bacterium]NLH62028.1 NADH-quinone oxidoreductase subunit C [Ignavibacteriales bacterium]HOJ17669.1 NADH-quinone oxidoreductase subunit C [Ignavibacteriaceae bacterium]HPO55589.1 NADH-quinone oxidoreductase subunit C [Ignavibacteriaceae bacterium]